MAVTTSFVSLPLELRIQIYGLVFPRCRIEIDPSRLDFLTSTITRQKRAERAKSWTIFLLGDLQSFATQLQSLDSEALPTFYKNVTCYMRYSTFDWAKRLEKFIDSIGRENVHYIRHLEIELPHNDYLFIDLAPGRTGHNQRGNTIEPRKIFLWQPSEPTSALLHLAKYGDICDLPRIEPFMAHLSKYLLGALEMDGGFSTREDLEDFVAELRRSMVQLLQKIAASQRGFALLPAR